MFRRELLSVHAPIVHASLHSPVIMFSLLSIAPMFGGVHHIAPDVRCHVEHLAATHTTGLDSSSVLVYNVEGHTLRHLADTRMCQEALFKFLKFFTQTCPLENGLLDGHSQLHVLASNSACISPKLLSVYHGAQMPPHPRSLPLQYPRSHSPSPSLRPTARSHPRA